MTITILLQIELTNGNDGRGHAFWRTAKRRKEYESYLRHFVHVHRPRVTSPVRLTVTRVLGKGERLWDYDSGLRGNWKEIQDAMVAAGWFPDDCPRHITACDFRQDATRRDIGPAIEVTITGE